MVELAARLVYADHYPSSTDRRTLYIACTQAAGLPGAWVAEEIARSRLLGAWSDSPRGRRPSGGISLPRR